MWDAVPVKHLLFLLRSNAVVFVHEIEKGTLGLFKRRIGAGLEVAKVGEDTLLEFFRVLHWSAKCLETKGQAANNIGARDVEKIVPSDLVSMNLLLCLPAIELGLPEHTRHIFPRGQQESSDVLVRCPVYWSRNQKVFY